MKKRSVLQTMRVGLIILLIGVVSTAGSVAAHQRGDSSTPGESGDDWTELAIDFLVPSNQTDGPITGDMFVLPSSGAEVVIGPGVIPSDPAQSDFEDQVIVTIPEGIGAVAVIQGLGYPAGVLDAYVTGFAGSMDDAEEIFVQSDRDLASGLFLIHMDRTPLLLFITVDTATFPGYLTIQVTVTSEGTVAESIALLRQNVSVNGLPMFEDIDEQQIQAMADDFSDD